MSINKGNIGNALHSVAPDHVTAVANDIYDEALHKYQSELNQMIGGGSSDVRVAVSELSGTTKSYTEDVGEFPSAVDGQITQNGQMNSYVYTGIDNTKKYMAKNFGVPSSSYTGVACVHYYDGTTWLGYEEASYHDAGPYFQTEDMVLNVPLDCDKIIICTQKNYPNKPVLSEVTLGNLILSSNLRKCIDDTIGSLFLYNALAIRSDGSATSSVSGIAVTDYLPITGDDDIYAVGLWGVANSIYPMAFYDQNKDFISVIAGDGVVSVPKANIPSGAKYIRCTANITLDEPHAVQSGVNLSSVISCVNNKPDGDREGKLMKVTKSGSRIYMRTALNAAEDIIVEYLLWENNNYTWGATYLGSKSASDATILTNKIHVMGDSTGPLGISSDAPWHLWTQHGYCIPYIAVSSLTLTDSDIGSIWKDQLNREYKIGSLNTSLNYIFLLPTVRETQYTGVYTRDWLTPSVQAITTLTHVSGATHTTQITATRQGDYQIRPMMTLASRKMLADGVEVTANGTYYCNEFVISETLNCTDPWTVVTWFPSPVQVDVGAVLTESFTMHGLSCRYDTILDMKKPYLFTWYGANQVQHFVPINTMSGYDVYSMIPRTKDSDWYSPHLANNLSRSSETVYRASSTLQDINKQADRYLTWFSNPTTGDKKIGCASGVSLTRGLTVDTKRNQIFRTYQSGDRECLNISPGNGNKAYFDILTWNNFENGILPASFIGQFSTYLTYFDPMANTGQVYWYKDVDGYVIYAHYQEAHTKLAINLPKEMEGMSVEVVDKTSGMTLLTGIVENGKVYVTADSTDHNYIVLKTIFDGANTGSGSGGSITVNDTITQNDTNPVTGGAIYSALAGKQAQLVSGTNIKTVNNQSILGAGNINIGGSGSSSTVETATLEILGTSLSADSLALDYSNKTFTNQNANWNGTIIDVSDYRGQVMRFTNPRGGWTFLRSEPVAGKSADYAQGYGSTGYVDRDAAIVPDDAKYLWVQINGGNTSGGRKPDKITFYSVAPTSDTPLPNGDAHLKDLATVNTSTLQAFFDKALAERRNVDLDGMTIVVSTAISLNNLRYLKPWWWWVIKNGTIIRDTTGTDGTATIFTMPDTYYDYPRFGFVMFSNITFLNSSVMENMTVYNNSSVYIYGDWTTNYNYATADTETRATYNSTNKYWSKVSSRSYTPVSTKACLLDGNRMATVSIRGCIFDGVSLVDTSYAQSQFEDASKDIYIQSLYVSDCQIFNLEYEFILAKKGYDIHFINNNVDRSWESNIIDIQTVEMLTVSHNLIQSVRSAVCFSGGRGISINENYFEGCRSHIVEMYTAGGGGAYGFSFVGNSCYQSQFDIVSDGGLGEYHYLKFANKLYGFEIRGNSFYVQSFANLPQEKKPRPAYTVKSLYMGNSESYGTYMQSGSTSGADKFTGTWRDNGGITATLKKAGSRSERPRHTVNITSFTSAGGYLNTSTNKWVTSSTTYGCLIDVEAHRGDKIIFNTGSGNGMNCVMARLTAKPVNGQSVSFATGDTGIKNFNSTSNYSVPADAKYLYILLKDGSTTYTVNSVTFTPDYEMPASLTKGFMFLDTDLGKPTWYTGDQTKGDDGWVDASGNNPYSS